MANHRVNHINSGKHWGGVHYISGLDGCWFKQDGKKYEPDFEKPNTGLDWREFQEMGNLLDRHNIKRDLTAGEKERLDALLKKYKKHSRKT